MVVMATSVHYSLEARLDFSGRPIGTICVVR
jgi:hypothetical protein